MAGIAHLHTAFGAVYAVNTQRRAIVQSGLQIRLHVKEVQVWLRQTGSAASGTIVPVTLSYYTHSADPANPTALTTTKINQSDQETIQAAGSYHPAAEAFSGTLSTIETRYVKLFSATDIQTRFRHDSGKYIVRGSVDAAPDVFYYLVVTMDFPNTANSEGVFSIVYDCEE